MHIRLTANTVQEIDTANGMLVFFCVPKDTPEIRQNIRGLITTLHRTRYYINGADIQKAYHHTAKSLEGIEVNFMCEDDFKEMLHYIRESSYTLKHINSNLSNDKEIKFKITQPEPVLTQNGEIDYTQNPSVSISGTQSVFEASSLLETNNIAELFAIATLDDGTIQLPDLNPFNLESKLDQIRSDITEAKDTHYWFAKAFYGGPLADLYPFGQQTFFARFSGTFNAEYPLTGFISESFHTLTTKINNNLVTSFNETNTDGVASNSYFRYLHTWLNSEWKLFHDLVETMRDCICEAKGFIETIGITLSETKQTLYGAFYSFEGVAYLKGTNENLGQIKGAIEGLQLNPTINNNIDPCCPDLVDATKAIADNLKDSEGKSIADKIKDLVDEAKDGNNSLKDSEGKPLGDLIHDLIDAIKDNGSVTTDNGDGTYTTKPLLPDYPVDPTTGETIAPYKPVSVKKSSRHNSKCGFMYWYLNQCADAIDAFANWVTWALELLAFLGFTFVDFVAMGTNVMSALGLVSTGGAGLPVVAGVQLAKTGGVYVAKQGIKLLVVEGALEWNEEFWHDVATTIRAYSEEVACSPVLNNVSKQALLTAVATATNPLLGSTQFACWMMALIYDYKNADDATNMVINMDDYAQYCPCPLTGLFNGNFWNGVTGNGEKWLHLESDGVYIAGTSTSVDLFGTLYESELVNGLIDGNNELAAGGTLHVISHTGFPDSGFTMSTNVSGSEVYFGNPSQTYTRQ